MKGDRALPIIITIYSLKNRQINATLQVEDFSVLGMRRLLLGILSSGYYDPLQLSSTLAVNMSIIS